MSTQAQYASIPRLNSVTVRSPDTSRTSPSVVGTVLSATATAASGTRIDNIDLVGINGTTSSMLRLFTFDGTTYNEFMEVPVAASVGTATTPPFMQSISSATNGEKFPLIIPTGTSLRATINDAQILYPANATALAPSQSIASGALASLTGGSSGVISAAASTAAVSALQTTAAAAFLTQTAFPYVVTAPSALSLTSAGNISTVNFTITGNDASGVAITETIAGPNINTVYTINVFASVEKVYANGAVATTTSVGYAAVDTLPIPTQITISSSAALTTVSFTIIGTNALGVTSTETLVGPVAGATVTSANTYKSVSIIRPNGAANPVLVGIPTIMGGVRITARGGDFA